MAIKSGTSGLIGVKIWHTMRDERVRPQVRRKTKKGWKSSMGKGANHMVLEGQTVKIGEKFDLGDGVKADTPGKSGVAGHDINCRCFVTHDWLTAEEYAAAVKKQGDKTVDKSAESSIIKTGAVSGAKKSPDWKNRHAEQMYEQIRHRTTDVKKISNSTPFTEKAVEEIKQHMFFKEHKFADGTIKRFDYDFDQAQAWDRLTQGIGTKTDLLMLKHEYVELTQMKIHNYDYETAHAIANSKHNWWAAVEAEEE